MTAMFITRMTSTAITPRLTVQTSIANSQLHKISSPQIITSVNKIDITTIRMINLLIMIGISSILLNVIIYKFRIGSKKYLRI